MDQEWLAALCCVCALPGSWDEWVCVGSVFQHCGIVLLVQRVWEWKLLSLVLSFLIPGGIYICCPRCSTTSRGGNSNFPSGSFFSPLSFGLLVFQPLDKWPLWRRVVTPQGSSLSPQGCWGGSDGKERGISHHFDIKGLGKTWNGVGCLLPKPVFMGRSGLQHIRHYKYRSSAVNISNLITGSGNSL